MSEILSATETYSIASLVDKLGDNLARRLLTITQLQILENANGDQRENSQANHQLFWIKKTIESLNQDSIQDNRVLNETFAHLAFGEGLVQAALHFIRDDSLQDQVSSDQENNGLKPTMQEEEKPITSSEDANSLSYQIETSLEIEFSEHIPMFLQLALSTNLGRITRNRSIGGSRDELMPSQVVDHLLGMTTALGNEKSSALEDLIERVEQVKSDNLQIRTIEKEHQSVSLLDGQFVSVSDVCQAIDSLEVSVSESTHADLYFMGYISALQSDFNVLSIGQLFPRINQLFTSGVFKDDGHHTYFDLEALFEELDIFQSDKLIEFLNTEVSQRGIEYKIASQYVFDQKNSSIDKDVYVSPLYELLPFLQLIDEAKDFGLVSSKREQEALQLLDSTPDDISLDEFLEGDKVQNGAQYSISEVSDEESLVIDLESPTDDQIVDISNLSNPSTWGLSVNESEQAKFRVILAQVKMTLGKKTGYKRFKNKYRGETEIPYKDAKILRAAMKKKLILLGLLEID